VQVIPHITNEIKARIRRAAQVTTADVVISEIGGTVGDIESLPFLEAIRQFRREAGPGNVLYLHVTLVPFIDASGELKTKPTQHSVNELRRIGIHPDIVVTRSREELSAEIRDKIALFTDVEPDAVIASPDVSDVYLVPSVLRREGLDRLVCEKLGLELREPDLAEWNELTDLIRRRDGALEVEIALVGKYVKLQDAYLSVHEALKHAGLQHGCGVRVRWLDAEGMSLEEAAVVLEEVDFNYFSSRLQVQRSIIFEDGRQVRTTGRTIVLLGRPVDRLGAVTPGTSVVVINPDAANASPAFTPDTTLPSPYAPADAPQAP